MTKFEYWFFQLLKNCLTNKKFVFSVLAAEKKIINNHNKVYIIFKLRHIPKSVYKIPRTKDEVNHWKSSIDIHSMHEIVKSMHSMQYIGFVEIASIRIKKTNPFWHQCCWHVKRRIIWCLTKLRILENSHNS